MAATFFKSAFFTVLTLILAAVLYGTVIEPRFLLDDVRVEAEIPNLAPAWEGQRVALFADLQIGMWGDNDGMARKIVEQTIEDDVALALFAGDFVYSPDSATVDRAVGIVRPLAEAQIPFLVVLGNHDHSLMKKQSEPRPAIAGYLRQRLEEAGATVLENEAQAVRIDGQDLWVAGIGSVWAGNSRPADALAAVPSGAPRLVLMHNPEAFRGIDADQSPLALAGHTHGGQVRVLGASRSWLNIVGKDETVADGWAEPEIGAPGNRLYVNRGVGFSVAPIRINCRPELTLFTLRASEGTLPEREPGSA
jgi:predicted MPP superfamily phosphohydrolase